jgi:Flp pilus assembly CpaF family ATPase
MMPVISRAFLAPAVPARLNMLLRGRTGSGKTTLSKSVLAAIDPVERLITIEDTLELTIMQPNVVRLLHSKDDLSGPQSMRIRYCRPACACGRIGCCCKSCVTMRHGPM